MKPYDEECESDHELPPEEIMGGAGAAGIAEVPQEKDMAQVYTEQLAMLSSAPAWEVMNILPSLVQAQQLHRNQQRMGSLDLDSLKRQISSAPAVLSELELEQLQEVQNAAAMALKAQQLQQAQAQVQAQAQAQAQAHVQVQAQLAQNPLYQNIANPMIPQNVFVGLNPYVQQQQLLQQQQFQQMPGVHAHHHVHHFQRNQKSVPTDKPRMVIDKVPPCRHNQWERISKKKNSISLRCRKCRSCWKTKLEFFDKCSDFYAGHCALGDECPHPHIYSKAAEKHQLIRQQEAEAAAAEGDEDGQPAVDVEG